MRTVEKGRGFETNFLSDVSALWVEHRLATPPCECMRGRGEHAQFFASSSWSGILPFRSVRQFDISPNVVPDA